MRPAGDFDGLPPLVIRKNDRKLVKNPLRFVDGRYQMDFDDLEAKAADPRNKILILCNPHNPIGRVWIHEELARLDEICRKHNVLVISSSIVAGCCPCSPLS